MRKEEGEKGNGNNDRKEGRKDVEKEREEGREIEEK